MSRVDKAPVGANIELWDFSGFAPYADENVPPLGDTTTEMQWYWESGHFKSSLGEVLLARIFKIEPQHPEWGLMLKAGSLDEHLQRQRAARDQYEIVHTREVAGLAGLAVAAGQTSGPARD